MSLRALANRLIHDQRGATMVEFAMVAPVLLMTMLGIFDMGHNIYTAILLEGSIQEAARDSSIEGAAGRESAIDAAVTTAVLRIAPKARLSFSRKAYTNFTDVGEPEDYTDVDRNGMCDNGDPFEDANGNERWDADRAIVGFGGARDAVLYTVSVRYPRAFPIGNMIGLDPEVSSQATTVLRNQPFGAQETRGVILNCA
jgi:Flp pilus assembly protein TadG